jgi:hypothetical protein
VARAAAALRLPRRQASLGEGSCVDVVECGDHDIGAGRGQQSGVAGAAAAAFRKLAEAGVNVELLLPVRISDEEFLAVICADDAAAAEGALGGQVISD